MNAGYWHGELRSVTQQNNGKAWTFQIKVDLSFMKFGAPKIHTFAKNRDIDKYLKSASKYFGKFLGTIVC
jgi:hypothetical protein